MFGGAAALAFVVGFGGVGVSSLGDTPTTTTHLCSALQQRLHNAAPGVHYANSTNCVAGLDC